MAEQTIHASIIRGLPKNNLSAVIAPTASDDTSKGYTIGSIWIDTITNIDYVCVDCTLNTAILNNSAQNETDATVNERLGEIEIKIKEYHHTQLVASDTLYVVHNLNKFPKVTVMDSTMSNEEVFGTVQFIDANRLNIIFGAAFSGDAYLT